MNLSNRSLSIDVMRGLTIALMIVVNTPGNWSTTYAPLLHADWHGFTPTDWVFPTFLFVMGNSMSFSFAKNQLEDNGPFLKKVFVRALIIFLIGYLLFWFPFFKHNADGLIVAKPFASTRIFGVLQRIALAYLFASLIIRYLSTKGVLWFSVIALIGYRIILALFGDLTLEGNAALKLDLLLIGDSHMYHGEGIAFDPEGILSTLPAIVNVIAGYWAGVFIQRKGATHETVAHLMVAGVLLVFLALWWDLFFPINKKLWTSSYVLYTVGIDLLVLSVLLYAIDIYKIKNWTYFFEVFGRNPLFIYVLSEVIVILMFFFRIGDKSVYRWIYLNLFEWMGGYVGSFLFALSVTLVCWFTGYILDKKKIYIKI